MNSAAERRATTVLIVDDHAAFLTAARRLLESEGLEVVGVAGDGATAVMEATRLAPDVVLLDVQLPDFDGFEVAQRLSALSSPPAVVLTSTRSAAAYGARLHDAAARGFIPKEELSAERVVSVAGLGLPAAPVGGLALPAPPAVT